MSTILQSVALLPQVLQDLIGEYNVDHRPSLKLVLDEMQYLHHKSLHRKDYAVMLGQLQYTVEPYDIITCDCCRNYIRYLSPDYELTYYDYRYYYCSYHCMNEAHYDMRKYYSRRMSTQNR